MKNLLLLFLIFISCEFGVQNKAIKLAKSHTDILFPECAESISKSISGFNGKSNWVYFVGSDDEGNIFDVVENRIIIGNNKIVIQYIVNLNTGLTKRGVIKLNNEIIDIFEFNSIYLKSLF